MIESIKNQNRQFAPLLIGGRESRKGLATESDIEGAPRINVADYGAFPDGRDSTPAIQAALQACSRLGACRLIFPCGRYDFLPDYAPERFIFVSNNDEGLKRIIFPLLGFNDLIIDGQGSLFMFHGFVNPFIIEDSTNVTLINLSIDFSRTFHSEGIIVAVQQAGVDVQIPENFPYRVHNGMLTFVSSETRFDALTTVGQNDLYGSAHILEFDTIRRETAFMARDYFFNGTTSYPATDLGNRRVRLHVPHLTGTVGNTLVFGPNHRSHPAIVVTHSKSIAFECITIFHAGGMGLIAQLSHNISMTGCQVTPSSGRIVSTTADATHFVNCTGFIRLYNNLFENQKDDATNIHGIYAQVIAAPAPEVLVVQLRHRQQHGLDFLKPGILVEFVQAKSMITIGHAVVTEAKRTNKEITEIHLDRSLPPELVPGDSVATAQDFPEVTISGNIIRNNRARGMLLNCRGRTVVEENFFHTPGAAILFEGDSFFWFEQGGVSDCTIRNNIFENCLFGVWGNAVIDVKAGILERMEQSRYNRNIRIEENIFRMSGEMPLLRAYCVDGLIWRNNSFQRTSAYPVSRPSAQRFEISHSDHVAIDESPA